MNWRIRLILVAEVLATMFTLWCLFDTTALSMTAFFSFGLPLYGFGAALYVWEVLVDLRRHRVL